ncbi:BLUF domain-containing protein [Pareuzebyella sediminis]|uniref:BLUF domain-containing protein n=1 Tax=Pareuzebyella sediminis TaxID=2607998 RepID=UPI0011ECE829|nr:BLUF domain-containing protein [Pareuzebyella sediminis]
MYTLTYESKATKPLTNADFGKLLKEARSFNQNNGITGCLISYRGNFIQILEGDQKVVQALYERIKVDSRHTDVKLFSEDHISERDFPDWGMAYYPIDENSVSPSELEQFKSNLTLLADLSKPTNVTAILFWKRIKFLISFASDDR